MPAPVSGDLIRLQNYVDDIATTLRRITANIPFKTETAAVFVFSRIESDSTTSAAAVSVFLLLISFVLLLGISYLARRGENNR